MWPSIYCTAFIPFVYKLFRGKVRAGLRQLGLEAEVPPETWRRPWVVDCRPLGRGQATLKYRAPYIFRVTLSNTWIGGVAHDQVTFRYRLADTKKTKLCTVSAEGYIRRFLQHVLPKGFVKVRYFGLFRPGKRQLLPQVRELLAVAEGSCSAPPDAHAALSAAAEQPEPCVAQCPACRARMELTQVLLPTSRSPRAPPG